MWSKAQKESLSQLLDYSTTFKESYYDNFLSTLSVPLGDEQARMALEDPDPNLSVVRQGLLAGGNAPTDINGMIFLFKHFREESHFAQAIALWVQGDERIAIQRAIGIRIHTIVTMNANTNGPATYEMIEPLVDAAVENDSALTPIENQFSNSLGEGCVYLEMCSFTLIFFLRPFSHAGYSYLQSIYQKF